jgi:hypothetical protein
MGTSAKALTVIRTDENGAQLPDAHMYLVGLLRVRSSFF